MYNFNKRLFIKLVLKYLEPGNCIVYMYVHIVFCDTGLVTRSGGTIEFENAKALVMPHLPLKASQRTPDLCLEGVLATQQCSQTPHRKSGHTVAHTHMQTHTQSTASTHSPTTHTVTLSHTPYTTNRQNCKL